MTGNRQKKNQNIAVTNRDLSLLTDSYKASHWRQYPGKEGTVFSYFESRGGTFKEGMVFYGLQALIQRYLKSANLPTFTGLDASATWWDAHMGPGIFNKDGFAKLLNKYEHHEYGLPLEIRALPEGTIVPSGIPMFTVVNKDKAFPWLTNWVEGLLVHMWYPITVASTSKSCKNIILRHLQKTGTPSNIHFKLHDFGFRGASSPESAAIGGSAHLVNFLGTDTVPGAAYATNWYDADWPVGYSVPAAEHSTVTSWGKEREGDFFEHMLTEFPDGYVAVVSDTWNIFDACEKLWGDRLKDKVLARKGTVVVRPDSGDPATTVRKILGILGEKYGRLQNEKGYYLLPPEIRIIQGDGVNRDSIDDILTEIEGYGWSADNVTFGMGGALLQQVNRDTCKFALKASYQQFGDHVIASSKEPMGDSSKASKAGLLGVTLGDHGKLEVANFGTDMEAYQRFNESGSNLLEPVLSKHELVRYQKFEEVRQIAGW